jgi:hypothetical protein
MVSQQDRRDIWVAAVKGLCDDIERWAASRKWPVERQEKTITEQVYGTYAVPELAIATPQGRILINPIALDVRNADGRVDIEAFPSFVRFVLLRQRGEWVLSTDQGIRWPEGWSEETFGKLALELCAA